MASFVSTDFSITINAVDLSDHGASVTLDYGAELQDFTAFSHTTKGNRPGLFDWTLTVEFFQDFAASNVDATIQPLLLNGTEFTFLVRPTSSAVSATNPNYTSTAAIVESYGPIAGSAGEAAKVSVTIRPGVNATLTRATS